VRDPMGDRMKQQYEDRTRFMLPRRTYTILRLDGRAFHTVTKNMQRPFSLAFAEEMAATAIKLCQEVSGTVFAYTQSDEISLLLQDFESIGTQPWFDGNIQKMASVSAGIASRHFSTWMGVEAEFDCRVFTIPDPVEVANYFLWRQRDAWRNAILAYAQHKFGQKAIHGLDTTRLRWMLEDKGIQVEHRYALGTVVAKGHLTLTDGGQRSFWTSFVAPLFSTEPGSLLAKTIPPMPTLLPDVDVAEDAEGEDRDAQAQHAVPEPEPQAEAVADAHGSGNQVQEDFDE
jgi:tRNA(His) guanylyltransferase